MEPVKAGPQEVFGGPNTDPHKVFGCLGICIYVYLQYFILTQPFRTMKKNRLNFIFPIEYVAPKSLKVGHWLNQHMIESFHLANDLHLPYHDYHNP